MKKNNKNKINKIIKNTVYFSLFNMENNYYKNNSLDFFIIRVYKLKYFL